MESDTQLEKSCAAIIYAGPLGNPPSQSGFLILDPKYGSEIWKNAVSGYALNQS
jgi:hypothetical protein